MGLMLLALVRPESRLVEARSSLAAPFVSWLRQGCFAGCQLDFLGRPLRRMRQGLSQVLQQIPTIDDLDRFGSASRRPLEI